MQPTDEQADILLNNRFATAKFGWERAVHPSLERWLHRTRADAHHVGQGGQAVPERLRGALGERIRAAVEIVPECGHVPAVEKPETAKKIIRLYAGTR
jgi:pimeloyl-ACP methyl ester carboxylesterase